MQASCLRGQKKLGLCDHVVGGQEVVVLSGLVGLTAPYPDGCGADKSGSVTARAGAG